MDSMMDRSMNWSMYCMMYWSMYCMMYRSMNCVMNSCMMNRSMMYWSMYCMMYSCMMNRSRDGMDSVNRRGRDGLIVHGGSSIERGVNYWHRMSWFIHRWGHHCMGLLTYVLVDRGWLGFCYIRTGLRMMDAVMDRWLTGIFCRGRMSISMMGGGGVVAVLGVVDSGLYGGGMASLYHLMTDLETLDLGLIRDQHSHQEKMHTD